jgi:hypothetical protein
VPWGPISNAISEWKAYKERTGHWPVRSIAADATAIMLQIVVPLMAILSWGILKTPTISIAVLIVLLCELAGAGIWLFVVDWARDEDMRRRRGGR